MLFGLLLSPVPTICIAIANFILAKYFMIPLFIHGLIYTAIALLAGLTFSCCLNTKSKKNDYEEILTGIFFIVPTGIAFYKIATFWTCLYLIHLTCEFVKFLS